MPVIEMFWAAEYNNGQALPQLDPFLKVENPFSQVNHKNVVRFWWIPITPEMTRIFPGTRFNPLLKRTCVEVKGSKGFVARRNQIKLYKDGRPPENAVKCYVIGIEGGPRRELYPDGTIIDKEWPESGETQDLLHG
jgi:hypothetical protein